MLKTVYSLILSFAFLCGLTVPTIVNVFNADTEITILFDTPEEEQEEHNSSKDAKVKYIEHQNVNTLVTTDFTEKSDYYYPQQAIDFCIGIQLPPPEQYS